MYQKWRYNCFHNFAENFLSKARNKYRICEIRKKNKTRQIQNVVTIFFKLSRFRSKLIFLFFPICPELEYFKKRVKNILTKKTVLYIIVRFLCYTYILAARSLFLFLFIYLFTIFFGARVRKKPVKSRSADDVTMMADPTSRDVSARSIKNSFVFHFNFHNNQR